MLDWLRTARARRIGSAVVLVALLVWLGAAVARSLPTSSPRALVTATRRVTPTVRTYRRHDFSPQLPHVDTFHPGDAYLVTWQPFAVDADPLTGHTPVGCQLDFYGPYATWGEAGQVSQSMFDALQTSGTTGLTPVFAAPPLWLDALSDTQQQQGFTLPGDLVGGSYVVVAQSGAGMHLSFGVTVVQIVPRGA